MEFMVRDYSMPAADSKVELNYKYSLQWLDHAGI